MILLKGLQPLFNVTRSSVLVAVGVLYLPLHFIIIVIIITIIIIVVVFFVVLIVLLIIIVNIIFISSIIIRIFIKRSLLFL